MAGLVIFAIVTIVSLATGIPETLRYALLDINPGEESPGEALSIAIVALPVWICYLVAHLRNIRTSAIEQATQDSGKTATIDFDTHRQPTLRFES